MSLVDRKLTFYFWYSLALLVFVVAAFSIRAMLDTERLPPLNLALVSHTITCLLWLTYVPAQAFLVTSRRFRNHRTLGWWSMPLALLVLLTGVAISFSFLGRIGDRAFFPFFAGIVNFFLFSAFYSLGVARRRDADFHKHMMLYASVSLVLPAINRLIFSFDLPRAIAPVGWVLLFTAVPIYDLLKNRKVASASWVALLLVVLHFVISGFGQLTGAAQH